MRRVFTISLSLPALVLVIGCHPSVVVEGTPAASGRSSSSGAGGAPSTTTTGTFGGATATSVTASSGGVGGVPVSASTGESSGSGGSTTLQSSAGSSGSDSTSSSTGASSGGVGGTPVNKSSAASSGAGGNGGNGGAGGNGGSGGAGGSPVVTCALCSDVIHNLAPADTVCLGSKDKYLAVVTCACDDTCAAVCGVAGAADCLAAMAGNTPPDCAACLASASGCLTAWDGCVGDDGVNTALGGGGNPP